MSSRRLTGLVVALALGLAVPGAAQAKTYCVNFTGCPAGGVAAPSIRAASDLADADADADVVRVGPGTYSEPPFTADKETDIVGAGMGQTVIEPTSGSAGINLANGNSSISDLSMRFTYTNPQAGIRLQNGADVSRVEVTTSNDSFIVTPFIAEDPGTVLDGVRTDLGPTPNAAAAYFFEGGVVVDSTLIGGIGVSVNATSVRRSTIQATIGIRAFGSENSVARSTVITAHPRAASSFSGGVEVVSGNGGENASLTASHLTIVGPGSAGTGLSVRANASSSVGTASLTVSDSVVRGTNLALSRTGKLSPQKADLDVSHSAFNNAAIDTGGSGSISLSSNISNDPDPKFVDPAGLDFRLRYDSPLIDKGFASPVASDIYGDRLARTRVRDGNGTDGAQRDIGAFEYQRLAPTAAFTAAPLTPLVGTPVSFTNTSTDPDGDPLTYAWAFGDGTASAATNPQHAYGTGGARQATLTATDPTGLTGNAGAALTVTAAPVITAPNVVPLEQAKTPETAPVLSKASLLRSRFATSGKKRGTQIRFRLSKAARVTMAFERTVRGRRAGKRCVAATKRNRRARACRRTIKAGTLTTRGKAGAQSVPFTGRLRGRALTPGRYRVRITAVDPQGRRSRESSVSFTVVRR